MKDIAFTLNDTLMEQHLVQMLRNRALRYGEKEVFRFRENDSTVYQSYSWNQVREQVDKAARALWHLGYRKGDNIGLFSANRPQWTLADLGILAIRGVVVPFFSTSSRSQVKYIVEETSMKLMFTGSLEQMNVALSLMDESSTLKLIISFNSSIVPENDKRVMSWEAFLASGVETNAPDLEQLVSEAEPDELATIIYTSGTTGEPKGVMLGQDNFMSCLKIHDQRLDVKDTDVSMCFLPLSHIFERAWSFYMLHCGATLVFLENPKMVIEEMKLARPTLMCTVPRFFEKTYEAIRAEEAKWKPAKRKIFDWTIKIGHERSEYLKNNQPLPLGLKVKYALADKLTLSKLRMVMGGNVRTMPCSGAAIRTELLRFFHATGIFVNYGYGASETTATVSCFKTDVYEFGSCGTIMPEVKVKMDEKGQILIYGPTVFKGYYNKPSETAKVLQDGWYHSGDRGSFTPAGNLVMEDRINDIFKTSGGKFVSPQKIELLLSNDPFIEQVVVIGDNRKFISALIVPSFIALAGRTELQIKPQDLPQNVIEKPSVVEFYTNRLKQIQEELTPYERVVKFTLLSEAFSMENEALTSTLKLRRKVINLKYLEQIEKMYSAG